MPHLISATPAAAVDGAAAPLSPAASREIVASPAGPPPSATPVAAPHPILPILHPPPTTPDTLPMPSLVSATTAAVVEAAAAPLSPAASRDVAISPAGLLDTGFPTVAERLNSTMPSRYCPPTGRGTWSNSFVHGSSKGFRRSTMEGM